jgi:hypothetical protein
VCRGMWVTFADSERRTLGRRCAGGGRLRDSFSCGWRAHLSLTCVWPVFDYCLTSISFAPTNRACHMCLHGAGLWLDALARVWGVVRGNIRFVIWCVRTNVRVRMFVHSHGAEFRYFVVYACIYGSAFVCSYARTGPVHARGCSHLPRALGGPRGLLLLLSGPARAADAVSPARAGSRRRHRAPARRRQVPCLTSVCPASHGISPSRARCVQPVSNRMRRLSSGPFSQNLAPEFLGPFLQAQARPRGLAAV